MHEKGGERGEITPWRLHQCFGIRIQTFVIKRLSEQVGLLIISVDELKNECAIFNKFLNEMMSYPYMFCLRMLNRIFKDVNGIGIVTINGKMFLTNMIIKKEFLHP